MTTGFLDRYKGKIIVPAAAQQSFGKGAAATSGGGNIIGAQALSAAGIGNGNDTTEDVLASYALPANSLDAVGRMLYVYAWGLFANNTHSKTARLYFGSTVIVSTGAFATAALTPWVLTYTLAKQGPSLQVGSGQLVVGGTHGGCIDLNGTELDSAAITIKVTGQTGTAQAGDVLLKGLQIEGLN